MVMMVVVVTAKVGPKRKRSIIILVQGLLSSSLFCLHFATMKKSLRVTTMIRGACTSNSRLKYNFAFVLTAPQIALTELMLCIVAGCW